MPELTFLLRKLRKNTGFIYGKYTEYGLNTRIYRLEVYSEPSRISEMSFFLRK